MHSHGPSFTVPMSVSTTIARHADSALYVSQIQQKRPEPCVGQNCVWHAIIDFLTLPLIMIFNAFFRTRGQILCTQSFWSVIPIQILFSCMRKMNRQLTSQITLHADTGTSSPLFFIFFLYFGIGTEERWKGFPQLVSATSVLQHCLSSKVHCWEKR